MLNQTLVLNTIQKEIRNKGVIFLFISTLAFLWLGHKAAVTFNISFNDEGMSKILSNTSQMVIIYFVSFCANFVAIILASTIVRSDMSSRVLPQLLAFPISRFEYLMSRITGAWILSIVFFTLSMFFGVGILLSSGNIKIDVISLIGSYVFMSVELLGIILICSFISLYGNRLVSFISAIVVYFISKGYTEKLHEYEAMSLGKILNIFMYYCTPRLGEMTYIAESYMGGKAFEASQLAAALVHFFATTTIWLFVMKTLFERKEV